MIFSQSGVNKKEAIIAVLGIIIFAVLGFYSWRTYDERQTAKRIAVEKEELMTKFAAGELGYFAGIVYEVTGEKIAVRSPAEEDGGAEIIKEAALTASTIVRRIEFQDVPEGSEDLVPAIQTLIALSDLQFGDDVMVNIDSAGRAAVIDFFANR